MANLIYGENKMFVRVKHSEYNSIGSKTVSGDYMAIFQDYHRKLYAACRYVKLSQCGHYMVGKFRIGNISITVSGEAGNNGLPLWLIDYSCKSIPFIKFLTEIPDDLVELYWDSEGHNEIGPTSVQLRSWAARTFKPTKMMRSAQT